jgi:hypothetical protein
MILTRTTPLCEHLAVRMACAEAAVRWSALGRSGCFRVLEVGVCRCVTGNALVGDLVEVGVPYEYVGVDDYGEVQGSPEDFQHPNMKLVLGHDNDAETVRRVRGPFHFMYLDADHTYGGVLAEVEHFGPLLEVGFLLAMHDIGNTGSGQVYYQLTHTGDWAVYHEFIGVLGEAVPGIGILEKLR